MFTAPERRGTGRGVVESVAARMIVAGFGSSTGRVAAMPRQYWLIDGYNLLHAAGMARERYGPGELEKARDRLLNHLATRLADDERSRTTVVFDGRDPWVDGPRVLIRNGLRVEFAPSTSDADSCIEELIARHPAPRQLTVVSSDRRLQSAIKRRRGRAQRSEEFASELDRRPRADQAGKPADERGEDALKSGAALTASDVSHWETVFADAQQELEAEQKAARRTDKPGAGGKRRPKK